MLQQRNCKQNEQNQGKSGFSLHKSLDEFDNCFQTTVSKRDANCHLDFNPRQFFIAKNFYREETWNLT